MHFATTARSSMKSPMYETLNDLCMQRLDGIASLFEKKPLLNQTFTINPQPPLATREAPITMEPAMTNTPPKTQVCGNPVAFNIWPEMGVPINNPIETTVKHMPIRVPIIARFAVRCTRMVGGRETKLPEKNP